VKPVERFFFDIAMLLGEVYYARIGSSSHGADGSSASPSGLALENPPVLLRFLEGRTEDWIGDFKVAHFRR
jgi:hypothetical protein